MLNYDVTVIGGGPGGYVAAIRAARLGGRVALIEKAYLGGTCLNKGCIPTKTLLHGAEFYKHIKSAEEWGISVSDVEISMGKLMQKKNQVIENLKMGIQQLMKANKIDVYYGFGRVHSDNKVTINTENEEIEIETKNIILATGSNVFKPPFPGKDLPGVLTSDEILDLEDIPEELVVIGAGVIGLEFACLHSSLGCNVTVIEAQSSILPMVDDEIVKRLIPIWKRQGIKIEMGALVESITNNDGKLLVKYSGKKGNSEIVCDKVLVATGRKPCVENEALGLINLEIENNFIKVNNKLQTNIPNIFAIGDIVKSPMLAHVASVEGIIAAENAMGLESEIKYDVIPSCIYSSPEIANVGLTEKEAKEKYENIKVCKISYSSNGRSQTLGEQIGILKMIMDENTKKIIGAHIFGYNASELIAEIALAMNNSLTVEEIAHTVHSHPSLSELIAEAAHALLGSPIHTV